MIHKFFDGVGNLEHATGVAERTLKTKKDGATIQISYWNGHSNFIKKDGKIEINGGA